MEENSMSLYIPVGVKLQVEWFPGLGKMEFFQGLIGSLFSVAIAFFISAVTGSQINAIVVGLVGVAGSFIAFSKDESNLSVAMYVTNLILFSKSQKVYHYVAGNEWE